MWCITAQLRCPSTNQNTAASTFFVVGDIRQAYLSRESGQGDLFWIESDGPTSRGPPTAPYFQVPGNTTTPAIPSRITSTVANTVGGNCGPLRPAVFAKFDSAFRYCHKTTTSRSVPVIVTLNPTKWPFLIIAVPVSKLLWLKSCAPRSASQPRPRQDPLAHPSPSDKAFDWQF